MQGQVQLSLTSSTAWCPFLFPLHWVRAHLQSHLTLCWGTQVLGDFCKAESPFSRCRLPHISHLLSAISGVAGWLAQSLHPAQLTRFPSVSSLQGPELQCPRPLQEPILWYLQFAQWPWAPHSLQGSCPQPWAALQCTSIWPAAHSPSRWPTRPTWKWPFIQDCSPDLAYTYGPGFTSTLILQGNSQKLWQERKVCVL